MTISLNYITLLLRFAFWISEHSRLRLQFAQAHEKTIIDGQRVQIMLSQLRPHFLFNSPEVLRGLNRTDPGKKRIAPS